MDAFKWQDWVCAAETIWPTQPKDLLYGLLHSLPSPVLTHNYPRRDCLSMIMWIIIPCKLESTPSPRIFHDAWKFSGSLAQRLSHLTVQLSPIFSFSSVLHPSLLPFRGRRASPADLTCYFSWRKIKPSGVNYLKLLYPTLLLFASGAHLVSFLYISE